MLKLLKSLNLKIRSLFKRSISFFTQFIKWLVSPTGVVVTLLIGVLISFVSYRVQDLISRQRYLELLQFELRYETLDFNSVSANYNKDGFMLNKHFLKDDVYKSGLNNGYILSIDSKLQTKILTYYQFVPIYNQMLSQDYDEADKFRIEWASCVLALPTSLQGNCDSQKKNSDTADKFYSYQIFSTWLSIYNNALKDLGTEFHPTEDRLNSPLLRILMGTDTLEFLKK